MLSKYSFNLSEILFYVIEKDLNSIFHVNIHPIHPIINIDVDKDLIFSKYLLLGCVATKSCVNLPLADIMYSFYCVTYHDNYSI